MKKNNSEEKTGRKQKGFRLKLETLKLDLYDKNNLQIH